ncbi:MAG TPA: hypothetical protein VF943_08855 [Burkholderiales bacterium]
MHCELVVPGLLAAKTPGRFPSIELLLARSRRRNETALPFESWLLRSFQSTSENIPAGALTVLAAGREPGAASWVRADPVHLRVMRDHLAVLPPEGLEISRKEADALCDALNRHFAGSFVIEAVEPRRWCARLSKELAVGNAPALESAGREMAQPRDSGPLLTEIQMLLHAHPVNAAREARGEPVLNSLWLWGAGRAAGGASPWNAVLSAEPLARGLARLAGARHAPLPAAAAWLERAPEVGRVLVVLDALRAPAALEDFAAYGENLHALEATWFAPLLAALRSGRAGMLTVHVPDSAASFETVRGDLRRFWRRPHPLESLA